MINRDDITIRAIRDRLHCPSLNDPDLGSHLEIQYKAYITGKSTIAPGDLKIDFVFEGQASIDENPGRSWSTRGLSN